nr:MAG TPA: hypothetical protein [Caudoviricetes sp.]
MLIRSQDKTALVKFENIVINLKLPESLRVICWSLQDAQRSGGYFVLGEYSTKAKAMKVLDMIQEAYAEYKISCTFLTGFTGHRAIVESNDIYVNGFKELAEGFKKNMVFQMPADSEVEV